MRRMNAYDLCVRIVLMVGVIGCCLILFGCKTKKVVDEVRMTHTEANADHVTKELKTDKEEQTEGEIQINSWRSSDVDITIDEYDTAKADSTGKSPLKKRTTIRGKKDEAQSVAGNVSKRVEELTDATTEEDRSHDVMISEERDREEDVKVGGNASTAWVIVIYAALAAFTVYLIRTLR